MSLHKAILAEQHQAHEIIADANTDGIMMIILLKSKVVRFVRICGQHEDSSSVEIVNFLEVRLLEVRDFRSCLQKGF